MKVQNVFDIYQNCSLGALLLNEFVSAYESKKTGNLSPSLEKILPILPILFTKDLVDSARGRSTNIKGFYNLVDENKVLFELLTLKVEEMFDKTMFSLLICSKAELLDINLAENTISSNQAPRKKYTATSSEIGNLIRTSRKLAGWFSKMSDVEFLLYLNIKF
nr:three component ABC system middle component [uncultured Pedobacter sp.]